MKIGVGADHRGYKLKSIVIKLLSKKGYSVVDYGTDSEASTDYPHYAIQVARDVAAKKLRFGILLCFSGQGMAIAANKVKGIRAAVCNDPAIAKVARAHNNANVLVISAGFVKPGKKLHSIIDVFLSTKFEGGRHLRRLNLIKTYENSHSQNP